MLLILIPVAWLAIVVVFVTLCRIAASADAAPVRSPERGRPSHRFPGLVLFDAHPARAAHDGRLRRGRAAKSIAGRGVRI